LREVIPPIQAAGAHVVIVGNGTAEQAAQFSQDVAPGLPIYTDPTLQVYHALGARRNLWSNLHPRVFIRAFQARRQGHRQTGVQGDAWQQGGVFLIRPDGTLPYVYQARYAGDHPEPTAVLAAVRAALSTPA
jgi:hypothetical protein